MTGTPGAAAAAAEAAETEQVVHDALAGLPLNDDAFLDNLAKTEEPGTPAKPAAEVAAKDEGATAAKAAEPASEAAAQSGEYLRGLRESIDQLAESLTERLEQQGQKGLAKAEKTPDVLDALESHKSPIVRTLASQLREQTARAERLEQRLNRQDEDRFDAELAKEEHEAIETYGLSADQVQKAMKLWETEAERDPRAAYLRFDEVLGRLYGRGNLEARRAQVAAARKSAAPPANGQAPNGAPAPKGGPAPARIVTEQSLGAPPARGFQPRKIGNLIEGTGDIEAAGQAWLRQTQGGG